MSHPLDKIYVPMTEALAAACAPNWEGLISTLARVTGQSEAVVADTVAPLKAIGPALTLPRFMPAATCESWLLAEAARQLGVESVQWFLSHDKYAGFNPEKLLMIKHRIVRDPSSPNPTRLMDQQLVTVQPTLNGLRLNQIQVVNGHGPITLVDFHHQWWQSCGWGGVEVDASQIAQQLLGDYPRKEQWYPVYFLLMCGNLVFLENYSPRYCLPLWPMVGEVWEATCRLGHRPLIVKLPLTPEIDWFLENATAQPPKQVSRLLPELLG